MNIRNCNNCEYYVEEYNYSICIENTEKPLILPNGAGVCIAKSEEELLGEYLEKYLKDIDDVFGGV